MRVYLLFFRSGSVVSRRDAEQELENNDRLQLVGPSTSKHALLIPKHFCAGLKGWKGRRHLLLQFIPLLLPEKPHPPGGLTIGDAPARKHSLVRP